MKLKFILSAFLIGSCIQSYGMQSARIQQMQDTALQAIVDQAKNDRSVLCGLNFIDINGGLKEFVNMFYAGQFDGNDHCFDLVLVHNNREIENVRMISIFDKNEDNYVFHFYDQNGNCIHGEKENILGIALNNSMIWTMYDGPIGDGIVDGLMSGEQGKSILNNVKRVILLMSSWSSDGNQMLDASENDYDAISNYFRYGTDAKVDDKDSLKLIKDKLIRLGFNTERLSQIDIRSEQFENIANRVARLILKEDVAVSNAIEESVEAQMNQAGGVTQIQEQKAPEFLDPDQPVDFNLFK